jgi:hypothetical protein
LWKFEFLEENRDVLIDNNRLRGGKAEAAEETEVEDLNSGKPLAMTVKLTE